MRCNAFVEAWKNYHRRASMILGLSLLAAPLSYAVYAEDGVSNTMVQVVTQTKTVKGTIIDESGEPLIGVSIVVKGTSTGTITDFNGNFSIDLPAGRKELVISYIGYKEQTVTVTGNGPVNVKMVSDTQALDEVVVIGYGAVKKRDLTGAVASVKSEDITMNPGTNPMEALQGKVAGLDITRESGQAGSGVKMQLRGNRSLTASGNPMFIIDGMPGDYATLNPNDIESIEVLKDASSTAVYGSSGANGVVIITTKGGKEGKLTANFNAFFGINSWSTMPEVRQGETYMEGLRTAHKNAGTYVDDANMFTNPAYYEAYQNGKYIDWVDELLHTGTVQNYSLSVSGGTKNTKAYMSMNFSDENGQYNDDNYKLYSTNIRIDHTINKWFTTGISIQASYVHQNKPFAKIQDGMTAIPYGEIYDENGNVNPYPIEGDAGYLNLLMNNKSNWRNQSQNTKLYVNPYIKITPIKGLTWESRVNGTLTYSRSNSFQGDGSYNFYKAGGNVETDTNAKITQNRSYNYKWENIVTYNFNIAKIHEFTLTGVSTWNHNQTDNTEMTGTGIANNKYLWEGLEKAAVQKNSSSYTMSKGVGLVGRINYSLLGRYLLSASIRRDGSSRLAKDHKWSNFPAVSLGWRISDEKFMGSTRNWLDNLKIRVGYGISGTASIDPYSSSSSLESGWLTLGGEKTQIYNLTKIIANPELTWERSKNTNIGIDASFLNNRINVTLDMYKTKTEGVIWKKSLPVVNGSYSSKEQYLTNINLCETKNKGLELALNTRNIETKNFQWTSALTFAYNKEEITKLTGTANDKVINGDYTYAVGSAINSFYHYKLDGIWQKGEEADAAVFGLKPGAIKINVPDMVRHTDTDGSVYYTKVNADGQEIRYDASNTYSVSADDYQVLGHNSPDWTMGFQNTLTYKDFDLSIYMYMRWGQMIKYSVLTDYDPTGLNNYPTYFNVWSETNPSNDFPAMDASIKDKLSYYPGFAALSYVDGSFFKIKNITLGYTMPDKLAKKLGLGKLRVYGTITNPFVIAKSHLLKDYDPEMNGGLNYPLTKQLVFGLNLSF